MTNSPLDEIVLRMFQDEQKDLLAVHVSFVVGKGEPRLVGIDNISGNYNFTILPTQEKEIAEHLVRLEKSESRKAVKQYLEQHIRKFQTTHNRPLFHGNVPFFLYAMHLIDSFGQKYDTHTATLLNGIMRHTILEQACPTAAETLPTNLIAIFHHHIYEELRRPSEHETRYAVPTYVVVTGLNVNASTLYRCVDKDAIVVGAIAHSPRTQDVLSLRKRPQISYDKDGEYLRFVARSDYCLRGIGAYKFKGNQLIPFGEPRFFSEPTSTGYYYVRNSDIKDTDTVFAFAIDEHYRASVAVRLPLQNIPLKNAGKGMI